MTSETNDHLSKTLQAMYEKAKEAYDRNNLNYALTLLENILQSNPTFHKARSLLRIVQIKDRDTLKPNWPKKISTLGRLIPMALRFFYLFWKKKWLPAVHCLEKILKADPSNTFFLQRLAQCSLELEWTQTAVDTLEILKKLAPGNTKAANQLAQLYMKDGNLEKARKYFEDAVRSSPNDPTAMKGLKDLAAMKTIEQGGWSQNTSYREKIKDEREAELLEKKSQVTRKEEDFAELVQDTLKKLESEPDHAVHLKELARLYEQAGQNDLALQTYEKLARVLPFDENIKKQISDLETRKMDDEIFQAKSELSKNPKQKDLSDRLSDLERKKRERQWAETKLRVERYPNNLTYRYELGLLNYELGRFNEAIQQFQLAAKDPQRHERALYHLGLCFKETGFHDLAEKQFLKVLEELTDMDNFKKEVIYHLGLVYEATHKAEKAVAEYKKIFEVDIGFKDVAEKIKKAYGK